MTDARKLGSEIFWAYRILQNATTGDGQHVTALGIAMAESAIERWCDEHGIAPTPPTYAELLALEERRVA